MAEAAAAPPEPVSPTEQTPAPGSGKRRQSSISESDSKRPRLSRQSTDQGDATNGRVSNDKSRRQSGQAEERKRGQRLFGALLGTLSQSSSSAAQKRRADIERKQQAKLKHQAEEYDEKKRKELDELIATRRKEQRRYDEQSMRIRHSNMRAMAHFFQTKTEPKLYYKPWELSRQDEDRLAQQIRDVDEAIEKELQEANVSLTNAGHAYQSDPEASNDVQPPNPETVGLENSVSKDLPKDATNNDPSHDPDALLLPAQQSSLKETGDDGGEVVDEGEEDTVIY